MFSGPSKSAPARIHGEAAGQNTRPGYAVVIEWDNARISELERAVEMLGRLRRQIAALPRPPFPAPRVLITYDPQEVDPAVIRGALEEAARGEGWPARVELRKAAGAGYYEHKNIGAAAADRELVVFLDSDVIPEEGWLEGLLRAFDEPGVDVVCGNTYVATDTLYRKAFALFWFFPTRSGDGSLVPSPTFFANNVAFRREVFAAHPYPSQASFRGQCAALARELRAAGHEIHMQRSCRVSHPPPNGLGHFVSRALCEGHDDRFNHKVHPRGRFGATPLGTIWRYLRNLARSFYRSFKLRRAVGLGFIGAFGACAIAAAYYTIKLLGELISYVRPELIRRHTPI